MSTDPKPPKVFISYSWTSPEHEEWVLQLATELVQNGVDIKLDKWDLKEGHDSIKFMEQSVSNSDKVLLIFDKKYVEKSDKREGGAGTEAQIISPDIYGNSEQNKFAAILREKSVDGKLYVPIYYKSRIYIDMSEDEKYISGMEQVLRWIFDKPLHEKPNLGKIPDFLNDDIALKTSTSLRHKQVLDAIKHSKPNTIGLMKEYFDLVIIELESLRFIIDYNKLDWDEEIIKAIDRFDPYLIEIYQICKTACQYNFDKFAESIGDFLERIIPLFYPKSNNIPPLYPGSSDFDYYKFIGYELFLITMSCFLESERFDFFSELSMRYYLDNQGRRDVSNLIGYSVFFHDFNFLKYRENRLKNGKNIIAKFANDKITKSLIIDYNNVITAEIVLYFIYITKTKDDNFYWYPNSIYQTYYSNNALPVFIRSESLRYFEKVKKCLGVTNKTQFNEVIQGIDKKEWEIRVYRHSSQNILLLMNSEKLCTLP
jgi:hypothetical protein